jgi:hypothetical protein
MLYRIALGSKGRLGTCTSCVAARGGRAVIDARVASNRTLASLLQPWLRAVTTLLLWCSLTACAVAWISPYSKDSAERITDISRSILGMYQELLSVEQSKRAAAANGGLKARHGEIETKIRVHLLLEQARARNEDSIRITDNLLSSWQTFGAAHQGKDRAALGDAALSIERGILERHLRSALIAEEAKKLGGPSGG